MKRIVWKYGLISGAVIVVLASISVPLHHNGVLSYDASLVLGYANMVLAFLLVFFGVRAYREDAGGAISFGKAFQVGILITLITCAIYVIAWEIAYWGFFPDFLDQMNAQSLAKLRASGATEAAIAAAQAQAAKFGKLYKNPLFNVAVTFLEIFPVGLIVTLVTAAILRRKQAPGAPVAAAA
ncbi:MAG TPA: DUF4199 domain-containing protein [Thermoanaerobaculia bacterium]|jgi:hypothetical protein|nr:DUF4199 domain-containing protein [Thermoanaerobaculia bacterium]